MTTGVIDIGTNTFNLLIQSPKGEEIYSERFPVKLGEGGINDNKITSVAYARGVDALIRFKHILVSKDVHQVWAFATSAVRDATNGPDFVREVEEKTGLKINVITGDQEAHFVYEGVKHALRLDERPILILDIGGGSNEFIIANKNQVFWAKSFPIGVARIFEKFKPSDPITQKEINALEEYYNNMLEELWAEVSKHKPHIIVGSSGSFETIHGMCAIKFDHEQFTAKETYGRIYMHEFNQMHQQLVQCSSFQRVVMPGMVAMRADTIHLASILINSILQKTGIKILLHSRFALKEGVINSDKKDLEAWQTSLL